MTRKAFVEKNKKNFEISKKYEKKRIYLKSKSKDISLSMKERMKFASKLSSLPRRSIKTRIFNCCQLTGRTRGVFTKFELSRIVFRELALSSSNGV